MSATDQIDDAERVHMALAEAGYPDLGPFDVGANGSVTPEVPLSVAWRAWQVCGVPADCLACCEADKYGFRRERKEIKCLAPDQGVEDCGAQR